MIKKTKFLFFLFLILIFVMPSSVLAVPPLDNPDSGCVLSVNAKLGDLFNYGTCIIGKSVVPLLFALAMVSFIWGVVQYVINADDEEKKTKGRDFMLWGIIALAVMISVWGLVGILRGTFGIENFIPQVKEK